MLIQTVANQDIAEHELLFRIPRASILSVENSILSTEIPASTFALLGPWLSLILVMIYEYHHGSASNWAPYFAVLPTDFNTLMFWSEDERFLSQFEDGKITSFKPYSKYPSCFKDVSFWVSQDNTLHENDFCDVVRDAAGDLVEDVKRVYIELHPGLLFRAD